MSIVPFRSFLVAGLFLLLSAAYALAAPSSIVSPNVVMIISDDHGWADYGFMGHTQVRTPHIDRLAAEGLLFRRGYVPSSLCCPSLASIITGRYPHQHKVTSNDPPVPHGMTGQQFHQSAAFRDGRETMNRHLEAVPTLPRLLAQREFASLQTGKWWQGDYRRGGFTHGMTKGGRHGDAGLEIGRRTMQPIYDFISDARSQRRPFFVWYAPMLPHQPHDPPERLLAKYRDVAPTEQVARYWAMIQWFDETVGQLLAHLDQQNLAQDTIVVYLADNGWIQNPAAGRYAEKSKQSPYDGGVRTPIIVRWPNKIAPRDSAALATSIDLVPTLLAAAGIDVPEGLSGIDLRDDGKVQQRQAIYGECFTHNAVDLNRPVANLRWRWIVAGDWKLIDPHKANEPGATAELYNVTLDPREEKNLAGEHADRVAELRKTLDAWWNPDEQP